MLTINEQVLINNNIPNEKIEEIKALDFIDLGRIRKNYIGQKQGSLLFLGRAPKPENTKDKRAFWWAICLNDFNIIKISSKSIANGTSSCGCAKHKAAYNRANLINKKFDKLTVLKYFDTNKGKARWLCQYECGNQVVVRGSDLTAKKIHSCGCFKKEKNSKHLENQKFGKLTVLSRVEVKNRQVQWLCQCECGNTIIVSTNHLTTGNTQSCGCLISKGEEKIAKWLKEHNIRYKRQYIFEDCKGKKPLRFDFAIFKDDKLFCLLEFQGIQHYENIYNLTEEEWQWSIQRDKIKKEYCKKNDIELFIIKYDEDLEKRLLCLLKEL